MSTTTATETNSLEALHDTPIPINLSLPKSRLSVDPTCPETPTPSAGAAQKRRKQKAKARAVSTGSIVDSAAGSTQHLPQDSTLDDSQRERCATEPPSTPSPSRPTILRETQSEPKVPTKSTRRKRLDSPEAITYHAADKKLAQKLRLFDVSSLEKQGMGYNYVLSMSGAGDHGDEFFKVGKTKVSADARQRQIHSTCGRLGEEVAIPGQVPSPYHTKAEGLILAELAPYRYNFQCDCGAIHKEYVKGVPKSHLVEATQRWTRFCESEPWDPKGRLHPFWETRLKQLEAGGSLCKANSPLRAKLWTKFACPSWWQYQQYNLGALCDSAGERKQLWMLVVLALIFSVAAPPSRFVVYLNTALQLFIMWSYTASHIHFASDKSHARPHFGGMVGYPSEEDQDDVSESGKQMSPGRSTREATVETSGAETMDLPFQSDQTHRSNGCPGSSEQNPIDLCLDDDDDE